MLSLKPSEVIYGMKLLTSSENHTNFEASPSADSKQMPSLDGLLQRNVESFDYGLKIDPKLENLSKCWCEVTVLEEDTVVLSIRWRFVSYCLKCLHCLQQSLQPSPESEGKELDKASVEGVKCKEKESKEVEKLNDNSKGRANLNENSKVAAPALGVQDQKTVKAVLQFIVCLGICPCLQTGVGIPLYMRSGFSFVVEKSSQPSYEDQFCLYSCLKILLQCTGVSPLGTIVLSQHLTDLLAGLLQVIHVRKSENSECKKTLKSEVNTESVGDPVNKHVKHIKDTKANEGSVQFKDIAESEHNSKESVNTKDTVSTIEDGAVRETINIEDENSVGPTEGLNVDINYCEKSLQDLLNRVYPPLLVKTLLLLQGGPKLKRPPPNKRPMLPPAPVWLRRVINQQLTTIMMRPKGVQYVLRGMLDGPGVSTGANIGTADWKRCDAVAKVIACCPLQSVSMENFYKAIGPQIIGLIHLEEKRLCQQYIRIACSTISHMAHQNMALTKQHVIVPLIEPLLTCTTNPDISEPSIAVTESSLSMCIEDCHKVFVCWCTDNPAIITSLQPIIHTVFNLLVFTKPGISTLKKLCHEIVVSFLKQADKDVGIACLELMTFQYSAQEVVVDSPRMHPDLLFQYGPDGGVQVVVSGDNRDTETDDEKTRVECIVSIMKALESTGLAGEFFVHMLKELTRVIQSEVEATNESYSDRAENDSNTLLNKELEEMRRVEQFYRKIMLLNVLASVCEVLGPSFIQNATHALEFVKATLERGVQVCRSTSDLMMEVFESETLSMAMGLLTATLTGAYQLTDENRVFMNELLPLLQEISSNHPESSVQEMATDIRIAIATHGAVWSDKTRSKTNNFSKVAEKIAKETDKSKASKTNTEKPGRPQKPKIEVLHESPNIDIEDTYKQESVSDKIEIDLSGGKQSAVSAGASGNVAFDKEDIIHVESTETIGKKKATGQLMNTCSGYGEDKDEKPIYATGKDESSVDNSKPLEKTGLETGIAVETIKTPVGVKNSLSRNGSSKATSDKPVSIGEDNDKDTSTEHIENPRSELDQVYEELCDALLPVRGHGLIRLTRMVQRRDAEILNRQGAVLTIFLENLDHADSYMYLASVNGLAALSDLCPDLVVPKLCDLFANFDLIGKKEGTKRKVELRMKIGEVLVKASRCLGDTIPRYRDFLIQSFLVGTKDSDPFVRASSLSNIGEICKLLRFSLGNIIQEVFQCCSSLLRYDSDTEVRKAAGQALTLLLQGMAGDSFKVLEGVIKDLYRTLKQSMLTEKEDGVKVHVTLALNELDDNMRKHLFPTQKLEKRIRVRDFE